MDLNNVGCPSCGLPMRKTKDHCKPHGIPCGWVEHTCGARVNSRRPNLWIPPERKKGK